MLFHTILQTADGYHALANTTLGITFTYIHLMHLPLQHPGIGQNHHLFPLHSNVIFNISEHQGKLNLLMIIHYKINRLVLVEFYLKHDTVQ